MSLQKQWVVPPGAQEITLGEFLTRVAQLSKKELLRHLNNGAVHVNRRRIKQADHALKGGERIRLYNAIKKQALGKAPVAILHQDDCLIIVDKRPGLPVGPTKQSDKGHLLDLLSRQLGLRQSARKGPKKALDKSRILHSPHRLDREVGGLNALSLGSGNSYILAEQFKNNISSRTYLALVEGQPVTQTGSLRHGWKKDPQGKISAVPLKEGPEMHTDFKVLGSARGVSLLQLELQTGRTHQIRVQLQASGWQLLGDSRYRVNGKKASHEPKWPALFAWKLELNHPADNQPVAFMARIPLFFQPWIAPMDLDAYDTMLFNTETI